MSRASKETSRKVFRAHFTKVSIMKYILMPKMANFLYYKDCSDDFRHYQFHHAFRIVRSLLGNLSPTRPNLSCRKGNFQIITLEDYTSYTFRNRDDGTREATR